MLEWFIGQVAFLWKWTGTWTEWKMFFFFIISTALLFVWYGFKSTNKSLHGVSVCSRPGKSNDVTLLFFTCFDFLTFWLYELTTPKSCRGSFFFTSNINLYLQNHSVVTASIRFYSSAFSLLNKYQGKVDISLVCQRLDKPFSLNFEVESFLREKIKCNRKCIKLVYQPKTESIRGSR